MKRFLIALVLSVASFIALAAPSPKQIEAALAARDYASAKTMITQVLAERPDSARAHLMKAYVLAAADKNKEAAKAELAIARTLDTRGDVINSPLFGRTVAAIDNIAVAQVVQPTRPATPPPTYVAPPKPAPVVVAQKEESHTGLWIFLALVFAGGVGAIVYFVSRRPQETIPSYSSTSYASPEPEPAPRPAASTYASTPAPRRTYSTPPPTVIRETHVVHSNGGYGSGMSNGAAMATGAVAGVGAAMVVDSMIEQNRLRNRVDELERDRYRSGSQSNTWAPSPAPAPVQETRVDYVDEAQSFSSSRSQSDSWSAPVEEKKQDSWSSSSSDSGSSDWGSSSSDSSSSSSSSSDW